MGITLEDAVYRNNKMREWVESHFPLERNRQIAWETFFAIRKMFPETEGLLRGEKIAGGSQPA
jgi:siroheme synthase (precorrin-2 oxidase/ferrochelatase)